MSDPSQGQVGCLLTTLALALGGPLLLVGLRVAANQGEASTRQAGKLRIIQARKEASAKRREALRPLQKRLDAVRAEAAHARQALAPLQRAAGQRRRLKSTLAFKFAQLPERAGLTLAAVQRGSTLGEAIAFTAAERLSDKGKAEPRRGAATSPYPQGSPANHKLRELYRKHGLVAPEERAKISAELRGMREEVVAGVLAKITPLPEASGRGLTLTLSDQLSPRAREVLLKRFKGLDRLVDSGWIQAWFVKKASHPEVLEVTDLTLSTTLASEFSAPGPLRSREEIEAVYADQFSYEFENESPQAVEIKLAGQSFEVPPYLWASVTLPPGRHVGTCRSLKDASVKPLNFELEGSAGQRLSTRLEIARDLSRGR